MFVSFIVKHPEHTEKVFGLPHIIIQNQIFICLTSYALCSYFRYLYSGGKIYFSECNLYHKPSMQELKAQA